MSLAVLFPGQGTQHAEMLTWLDEAPAWVCRPLVEAFGPDWRARLLDVEWTLRNSVAQPLLTGIGVAAWQALAPKLPKPAVIAGYSVGELAAFHAAGVIGSADAMAIAHKRAEFMDESTAGIATGLMSVANATPALIAHLCGRYRLAVAIRLAANHVVLGGRKIELSAAADDANRGGAKATALALAIASHTPWMAGAVRPLGSLLETTPFSRPQIPLVSGHEAAVMWDPGQLRNALAFQTAETVRWDECMTAIEERGVSCVLEVGPGSTLSRMWNARNLAVPARSVDDFKTLDAIAPWISRAVS